MLGFFQNEDAPNFGIDVSVQKARTANFFSDARRRRRAAARRPHALPARRCRSTAASRITSRAVGFLAQPFFPPGIRGTDPGPFSLPIAEWSPFNTGLQLDIVSDAVFEALLRGRVTGTCSALIPRLPNGITIFPGGVPLYKDGRLAGAIGISGDGVDQDDLIASAGSAGFEAPAGAALRPPGRARRAPAIREVPAAPEPVSAHATCCGRRSRSCSWRGRRPPPFAAPKSSWS